eukprot:489845-Rhodomonas_salina.1
MARSSQGSIIDLHPDKGITLREVLFGDNPMVQPGDIIYLHEGSFSGAEWCGLQVSVNNITIRGSGVNSVVDCNSTGGRHLHLAAAHTKVESLTFANGRCNSDNACPAPGDGGALLISGLEAIISDCAFVNCVASEHGGAVSATPSASFVTLDRVNVRGCISVRGGAVWSRSAEFLIRDSDFQDNHADAFGGAVYVIFAPLTTVNSNFSYNVALSWGGALFSPFGTISVIGGWFTGNYCDLWGGAVATH